MPKRLLFAVLSAAGLAASGSAQNALGGGNALNRNTGSLSRNLQVTGGRSNTTTFQNMVRLNDAIVTGNVAGGGAFRGGVGYTGANDFRSAAGSDDLFTFQRDSYASGLAARGVRGIESLRTQFALATGAGPNANTAVLIRPATGVGSSDFSPGRTTTTTPPADPFGIAGGSLRSPARFAVTAASEPLTFDLVDRTGASTRLGASSLRGVFTSAAPGSTPPDAERTGPAARLSDPAAPGPESTRLESNASSYDRMIEQFLSASAERREKAQAQQGLTPPDPAAPATPEQRAPGAPPPVPGSPEAAAEAAKIQPPPPETGTFEERLQRLRDRLQEVSEPGNRPAMSPADLERKRAEAAQKDPDAAKPSPLDAGREARDLFGNLRPRMERFIDPADDPGAYDRAMNSGQERLTAGRWFDAEEYFTRALVVKVGDPVAAAARVHAQLGGGMFLSAAINLRDLLRAHPEMAAVKFDPALLPREPRLTALTEALRDAASRRNDTFGRDAGLLLAYLGYQTGSARDVEAGFTAIARVTHHLAMEPDPLYEVLRAVWMP